MPLQYTLVWHSNYTITVLHFQCTAIDFVYIFRFFYKTTLKFASTDALREHRCLCDFAASFLPSYFRNSCSFYRGELTKKIRRHPVKTIEEKYRCVQAVSRQGATVGQVCRELEVSRSGYYGWLNRKPSERSRQNQALRRRLVELHGKYPATIQYLANHFGLTFIDFFSVIA